MEEAGSKIEKSSFDCSKWAFKYDGIKPNSLLSVVAPEELLLTRQVLINE